MSAPLPEPAEPTPAPVVLPRYTPLILAPRRRAPRNPAPLEPAHPPTTTYWVHWTYTEEEWQAWAEHERGTAQRTYESYQRMILYSLVGILALAGPMIALFVAVRLAVPVALVLGLSLLGGIMLLAGFTAQAGRYAEAQALYRLRLHGPREAAIGPWMVWQAGRAMPLLYYLFSRMWVRLTTQPPLQIRFRIQERPNLWAKTDDVREIAVLVPQGHEAEARQLVARFHREIINNPAATAHPPRQEPTPPPPLTPTSRPAITERLPPLPPLPTDADTQRFDTPHP
jgi:hypothetical protein